MTTNVLKKDHISMWRLDGISGPLYEVDAQDRSLEIYRPDVFKTIEAEIDALDGELRTLSMDIHDHPELKFEEMHAHEVLTSFMKQRGWEVQEHFHLKTAWVATFSHGNGGRTLGVNSEMDALPGIWHACGHNLIAISGVAVALAVKTALLKHNIPGKVVLLGTPAEEGGLGKGILLEAGAYEGMDACLIAHAALAPWEGRNALDAAVSAYSSIGLLRQQIKPSHRVHGIIEGRDWAPNIIPDHSKMTLYTRAPTRAEVRLLKPRVQACLEAAALATACTSKVISPGSTYDLRQNKALGQTFAKTFRSKYGPVDYEFGIANASTDFGNVAYALPSLHPGFSIPTQPNGGSHTVAFAEAAATPEAHKACLNVSKALALTGLRLLDDDGFFVQVKSSFEEDMKKANGV